MSFKAIGSCKEATRLLSEAMDRPLTIQERIALKIHLALCEYCLRFQKQVYGLHELIALHTQTQREFLPRYVGALSDACRARIQALLKHKHEG